MEEDGRKAGFHRGRGTEEGEAMERGARRARGTGEQTGEMGDDLLSTTCCVDDLHVAVTTNYTVNMCRASG